MSAAKMELSLSGNALKTFARCITCLARIGNELAIQASPSQVADLIVHFVSRVVKRRNERQNRHLLNRLFDFVCHAFGDI